MSWDGSERRSSRLTDTDVLRIEKIFDQKLRQAESDGRVLSMDDIMQIRLLITHAQEREAREAARDEARQKMSRNVVVGVIVLVVGAIGSFVIKNIEPLWKLFAKG